MKNAEKITPAVAELNEEMLDKVNGGCALTAAATLCVLTAGTLMAAFHAARINAYNARKALKKQQQNEQQAAAA